MKIKTKDLIGAALDWAVAKSLGWVEYANDSIEKGSLWHTDPYQAPFGPRILKRDWKPSNARDQGFEIVEREGISVIRCDDDYGKDAQGFCNNVRIPVWAADHGQLSVTTSTEHQSHEPMFQISERDVLYGPTPLIAAMRCYVASKLGEEVDVPDELRGDRQ